MKRKIVFLPVLILFAGTCHAEPGQLLTPADQTLLRVLDTGQVKADLTLIPSDQKADVILRLRQVAAITQGVSMQIGNALVHKETADLLLLRLGDKFTMERMIRGYQTYDSPQAWVYDQEMFERSRQPLLIPYLAQDFYLNEDPKGGVTTNEPPDSTDFVVSAPARSIFSGITAVRIIKEAPEFTKEMKAWAQQAYAVRLASPARFRGLMLAWWNVNKKAFERGEYGAVVPVAEPFQLPTN